jgi:arylsulfatase A-like enzyme
VFQQDECDALVEIRDLYPTISALAGSSLEDAPPSVSRTDLRVVGDSGNGRDYAVAEYLEPQPSMDALRNRVGRVGAARQYDRALRSLRTDRWTYIEGSDGDERLYDREADPRERTDVSDEETEVLAELRETLAEDRGKLVRNPGEERSVSGRTKRRLENMGYLQ